MDSVYNRLWEKNRLRPTMSPKNNWGLVQWMCYPAEKKCALNISNKLQIIGWLCEMVTARAVGAKRFSPKQTNDVICFQGNVVSVFSVKPFKKCFPLCNCVVYIGGWRGVCVGWRGFGGVCFRGTEPDSWLILELLERKRSRGPSLPAAFVLTKKHFA